MLNKGMEEIAKAIMDMFSAEAVGTPEELLEEYAIWTRYAKDGDVKEFEQYLRDYAISPHIHDDKISLLKEIVRAPQEFSDPLAIFDKLTDRDFDFKKFFEEAPDNIHEGIWTMFAKSPLPDVAHIGAVMIAEHARDNLIHKEKYDVSMPALFSMDVTGAAPAGFGSIWRITGTEGVIELSTADASLPAMEGLRISGAKAWQPMMPMDIPAAYECADIPSSPDRYPVYPGMDAPRASLVANAAMYNRLRDAIVNNTAVEPDFARAVYVQTLVAQADAAAQARRR